MTADPSPTGESTRQSEPETPDAIEQSVLLCYLAGRSVTLDRHERHAALRRAELLLATGGDPRRALELWGRAVTALAADLDDPGARAELDAGLSALHDEPGPAAVVARLRAHGDLAWQCFAMALLAEALGSED